MPPQSAVWGESRHWRWARTGVDIALKAVGEEAELGGAGAGRVAHHERHRVRFARLGSEPGADGQRVGAPGPCPHNCARQLHRPQDLERHHTAESARSRTPHAHYIAPTKLYGMLLGSGIR